MTALLKNPDWISPEDYIKGELRSDIRHEYIDGRVYAMAGASDTHNRIVMNLSRELGNHLRGKRCEPFSNGMKVKPPPELGDIFYYPDVIVACDPTDNARYYRERPAIICEVLSRDTRTTDLREKAFAYRQIASVEVYVVFEQERIAATVMRRADHGWACQEIEGANAVLRLDPIDVDVPLGLLYERTGLIK